MRLGVEFICKCIKLFIRAVYYIYLVIIFLQDTRSSYCQP